jgi:anaerobic selenocysteine-containing dehydrogenase
MSKTASPPPAGWLELHSERLRAVGLDPLPDYVAGSVPHDPRFPLTLTTAKWPQYCHSQQRNQPSLRKRMPEPLVEIHPETAAARGIRDGDWLEVVTLMGAMRARQIRPPPRAGGGVRPVRLVAIRGWGGRCQ